MKKVMLVRPSLPVRSDFYVSKDCLLNKSKKSVGTIPLTLPPSIEGVGKLGVLPSKEAENNKISVDSILNLASQLNTKERKELLARLSLSQNQESEPSRDKDMWAEAVYNEILRAFGDGVGVGQGPAQIKRCVSAGSAWASMTEFMEASKLLELQVTQRYAVYKLLAGLVVKQAKFVASKVQAPLSPKFIANCSQNIAGIFDAAFPGYLAAGLAPVVAKRLIQAS